MNVLKEALYQLREMCNSVFAYPHMRPHDPTYNVYWQERKAQSDTGLNSFQEKRADLTVSLIEPESSLMDLGAGTGGVLAYIHQRKPMCKLIAVDVSRYALGVAKKMGINTIEADISRIEELKQLPCVDYIFLFEIIEHFQNSEDLLRWAVSHSRKGVFFSVPNSGFFIHRLRLLFGKFPLQWRVNPSEHVRFWTVCDMRWWLKELGYINYKIVLYEGVPLLNRLSASLFGQGIWVYIPANYE